MLRSLISMASLNMMYFLLLVLYFVNTKAGENVDFSKKEFPPNFVFGVASSAYQCEGGYVADGKGLSNWDVFSHTPGNIADGKTGDTADDEYHRYREDVEIMADMGLDVYRFSIAWSRIYPRGSGEINLDGVRYYNDLIDELLSRGIRPFVTLSHYDIPQALEDKYGSWLSPRIANDFAQYADSCFRLFGDRVKYWTTFNEPNVFIMLGYDTGERPPSRCSAPFGNCSAGNSSTEPYIAAHNVLRAHAFAVDIYKKKYQGRQGGFIGIVLSTLWIEPLQNTPEDVEAALRHLAFYHGWYLDPIVFGEYPPIMRKLVGKRLPTITQDLRRKLRGSFDFFGLNYYGSTYAKDASYLLNSSNRDYKQDPLTALTDARDGVPIGKKMYPPPMYGVPYGIEKILGYIKTRYSNPPVFVTENGFGNERKESLNLFESLNDTSRAEYLESTLQYLAKAMRGGVDVRGYFVWSLLDNFEWEFGYTSMFGMYYVDFGDGLQRYPKLSAFWFRSFLQGKRGDYKQEFLRQFVENHGIEGSFSS